MNVLSLLRDCSYVLASIQKSEIFFAVTQRTQTADARLLWYGLETNAGSRGHSVVVQIFYAHFQKIVSSDPLVRYRGRNVPKYGGASHEKGEGRRD
jgi:hypothetical protein